MEGAPPEAGPPVARRPRRGTWVYLAIYLAVSAWLWRGLLPHLATRALGGGQLDPGLFIWWLRWTPFAIAHGTNPFHSTYLDAPNGVNAMWNTSVIALGVLFAPVTAWFGAVTSFNLACVLGPPLSAWTGYFWLRRHAGDAAAAVGGLVFGFSPFVVAESHAGHLMFTWLVLLPVILLLTEDLLWRAPRPLWPQAPLLGLAVGVQLLLGSEALLILSLGVAGMVAALAVSHPRVTLARLRVLVPAAALAAALAALLCAYPLYQQFAGRGVIRHPVQAVGAIGGRAAMLVHATPVLQFHAGRGPAGHLTAVENGLFVGWPLLVGLGLAAVALVRRRGVWIAVLAAVVAAAFQMYRSRLLLFVQHRVALTRNILPGRFAIVMWLAIAWLLAVAIDEAAGRVRASRLPRALVAAPFVAVALLLVPLLPGPQSPAYRLRPTPTFFTTALPTSIPRGATIMVAPMATVADTSAELWQVDSGLRFRQLGGYMLHARRAGFPSYAPSAVALTTLFEVRPLTGRPYRGPLTPGLLAKARAELGAAHAAALVVGPSRFAEARQLAIAQRLLGRPADLVAGGVHVWTIAR